ncbi:gamma-tubulin complex component 6 [Pseudomyrmex gracilis]|uniref:gamma-tubulin complex component 6 n=1 Tax=Pseudomyrmex gracilis TaxID=219809 RepID=UPI000994AFC9|nr:gamma-tubulin complex component 6 [Pseudomyrmex gracilis]
MELERRDANVYDLVTQLVQHIVRRNRLENDNYTLPKSDIKTVKRLRSKAYEILLNKSNKIYKQENVEVCNKFDPLVEILKHAFVLKTSLRRISEAKKLEELLNELYTQETNEETVIGHTLQLLIQLKNFYTDTRTVSDVFYYGKNNPCLPQDVVPTNGVPMFQTYPTESFILPEKFEAMLGISKTCHRQVTLTNFASRTSFNDQCASKAILETETIRYNNDVIEMFPHISSCTENIANQYNTPFLMHVMVEQTNKLYLSKQRFMSNIFLPCEWIKSVNDQLENKNLSRVPLNNYDCDFMNEESQITVRNKNNIYNINLIWKDVQFFNDRISKLRTWESLGASESSKELLFVTDLPETAVHLAKIRQTSILSLLPKKAMQSISLMQEISFEKFLSDVKLLLFGIDSDSFKYNTVTDFKLRDNISVRDISSDALRITCREVICWGNSFKSLSRFVTTDPQTGKLQQDGLIFKAMCSNIKELLLYYRSALHRIFNRYKFLGLLSLLERIRPMADLIMEVAKLCSCVKYNRFVTNGGSGILTHIYKEVTKITNPKVALVFYSILKSCCEVYFRMLQSWLFEGTCDDVYGEFMIQVRSKYLRRRGRKFWTDSFAIDAASVPGFLTELSDSILQCGKTLRLLKICNPKNPVCNISLNGQPEIRVCLSVTMLREQLLRCQEYERKGEAALGAVVSLLSAIEDEKKIEKETAKLVIRAQQETLSRLNKQREEFIIKTAQHKRELLQELKQQAEENALFKEKERESEKLADKLLLEKIIREQEEIREQQQAEKDRLLQYYDKLSVDMESNRARMNWRKIRMSHCEKRLEALNSMKKFDNEMLENVAASSTDENPLETDKQNISLSSRVDVPGSETINAVFNQDENSNFAKTEISNVEVTNAFDRHNCGENLSSTNCDADSAKNGNSDKDIASDKENVTNKDSLKTTDVTQNIRLPKESMHYVYKKNNERSNMQDFLRENSAKNDDNSDKDIVSDKENVTNKDSLKTADVKQNIRLPKESMHYVYKKNNERSNMQDFLREEDCENSGKNDDNSDKDIASDKEIVTNKDSLKTTDVTQNICLPKESMHYVYKKNNERSNLQDFLREEAMKNIHTIMAGGGSGCKQTTALNTSNILDTEKVTEKVIGAISRPKSLAIEKIDNMTAVQANKLKVLLQEYGMTPNNNEFNTIITDEQGNTDRTFINNQTLSNVTRIKERNTNNTRENGNNNISTFDIKLPKETATVGGPTDNDECSNRINNINNEAQESISNNAQQQQYADTPMSCTTENFTTLSTHTPLSQVPNSDDVFALNIGQEVSSFSDITKSITEETCFESPMNGNFKLPNLFGVSPELKSSTVPSSLTVADVEMIDHTSLQVYLEKSIIIPLQIQTRLMNNAIIKYLVDECNMLSHLRSLRSYFFLLNGEFGKSLTDSLYSRLYTISAPIELFNSATLTNLLEKALINSFSNNYANSELLSLSAVDKPCQLYISDPNVLECLCLNYKISWPLNIILDDTMMLQYSKVFKFLIMTGRMSWVLQEDFNIMKTECDTVNSEQYHKLQLYRHSMTQFMNALHNYLTCSVLHASWSEFEKDLQNSRTIDQIYLSHMSYIKRILSRCMLNTRGEKMRVCLSNIFKIILKFHNRLRSQAWTTAGGTGQYVHPNFKSLEQMYQSFCEWRTYMAHVAHKLATSGYQPHLTHFLNALNINHLYDLTSKQQP